MTTAPRVDSREDEASAHDEEIPPELDARLRSCARHAHQGAKLGQPLNASLTTKKRLALREEFAQEQFRGAAPQPLSALFSQSLPFSPRHARRSGQRARRHGLPTRASTLRLPIPMATRRKASG